MKYFRLALLLLLLPSLVQAAEVRVALVLDKGGKDDKSFNAAAFAGSLRAKKELGIYVKAVETSDDIAVENTLRAFASRNFDLIIGIGFAQAAALEKIAKKFPEKHFAIVDANVKEPNVRSLLFQEHEASYLVGALAALASKSGKIGFIGGMDIPLIRRFEMGFEAGVKKINPSVEIEKNYIGVSSEAWNNPAKAKELALAQYGSGVDVIFAAAGASNSGLFDAAEEHKSLAIGVDSNQNWVKPGFVLTSMLKRVDEAVFQVIKDASQNKFSAGIEYFGLQNHGVDYAMDEYNASLVSPEMHAKVEALKADIIAGKIVVPDYYKKNGQK